MRKRTLTLIIAGLLMTTSAQTSDQKWIEVISGKLGQVLLITKQGEIILKGKVLAVDKDLGAIIGGQRGFTKEGE